MQKTKFFSQNTAIICTKVAIYCCCQDIEKHMSTYHRAFQLEAMYSSLVIVTFMFMIGSSKCLNFSKFRNHICVIPYFIHKNRFLLPNHVHVWKLVSETGLQINTVVTIPIWSLNRCFCKKLWYAALEITLASHILYFITVSAKHSSEKSRLKRLKCNSEWNLTLTPYDRFLIEKTSNKFRTSLMSGTAMYSKLMKQAPQAGDIYRIVS